MLKFRTMVQDADAQREGLRAEHDLDDPMFKLVDDPRITSQAGSCGAGRSTSSRSCSTPSAAR